MTWGANLIGSAARTRAEPAAAPAAGPRSRPPCASPRPLRPLASRRRPSPLRRARCARARSAPPRSPLRAGARPRRRRWRPGAAAIDAGLPAGLASLRPPARRSLRALLRGPPRPGRRAAHLRARLRLRPAARPPGAGRRHPRGRSPSPAPVRQVEPDARGRAARRRRARGPVARLALGRPAPPAAAADAPSIEFEHRVSPELLGERPRQTTIDVLVETTRRRHRDRVEVARARHRHLPMPGRRRGADRRPALLAPGRAAGPLLGSRRHARPAGARGRRALPDQPRLPGVRNAPRSGRSPGRSAWRCSRSSTTWRTPTSPHATTGPAGRHCYDEAISSTPSPRISASRRSRGRSSCRRCRSTTPPAPGRPTSTGSTESARSAG